MRFEGNLHCDTQWGPVGKPLGHFRHIQVIRRKYSSVDQKWTFGVISKNRIQHHI